MQKNIIIFFLVLLGLFARFLPHPPNFTPVAAIALFSGIYLSRNSGIILALLVMIISDFFIGFYSWKLMLAVYLSFIMMVFLGGLAKKKRKMSLVMGITVSASILFFLITNAAVWIFSGMYEHTVSGLIQCYYMALPFFKNTLMGNLLYMALLVLMMEFYLLKSANLSNFNLSFYFSKFRKKFYRKKPQF